MGQTLSEAFDLACRRHARAVCMYEPGGAPISFENFYFTVISFAEALQDHGVRPGQLVAVHLADPIAATALRLAVLRLGATTITLPQRAVPDGAGFVVDWHLIAAGTPPTGERDIAVDGSWIRSPTRLVPIVPGGRLVRSSSGTTGRPKLRVVSDEGALARVTHGSDWRGQPGGAVLIGYASASTPFLNHFTRAILAGVAQVHAQLVDHTTLPMIDGRGIAAAYLSPLNFFNLLRVAQEVGRYPTSLRRIMVGGGEVAPVFAQRAEELFGCEVNLCYGSNETGSVAHCRPVEARETHGMVGRIYPDYQVRFLGDDGREVSPAEGGELWLRVPPDIRATEFPSGVPVCDADGWVGTGDLGRLAPDGSFIFQGRKADFLNVAGNKHAPQHFETLARQFDGLADVAVFRLAAETGGDEVGFAVVPAEGFDMAAFITFLNTRLGALYAFRVVVVTTLPVTDAGKVDRKRLSAEYAGAPKPHL